MFMRYFFILIMSLLSYQNSYSQLYEVGVFAGGSNFIGDVGRTTFIAPNSSAFGGVVKWNRSPRHSWRLSAIASTIEALDSDSNDPRRMQRNLSFNSSVFEISGGMEFTFFDFNQHDEKNKFTPYLYSGLSAVNRDSFYFNANGVLEEDDDARWTVAIPITLGVKAKISRHIIISAEVGARFAFSDALDGSLPDDDTLAEQFSFGNENNNDWYVFSGMILTYTFGKKPCYCFD